MKVYIDTPSGLVAASRGRKGLVRPHTDAGREALLRCGWEIKKKQRRSPQRLMREGETVTVTKKDAK